MPHERPFALTTPERTFDDASLVDEETAIPIDGRG